MQRKKKSEFKGNSKNFKLLTIRDNYKQYTKVLLLKTNPFIINTCYRKFDY